MASIKSVLPAARWLDAPLSAVPHSAPGWLQRLLFARRRKPGQNIYRGEAVTWLGQPCQTFICEEGGQVQSVAVTFKRRTSELQPFQAKPEAQVSAALGFSGETPYLRVKRWGADDGTVILHTATPGLETTHTLGLLSKRVPLHDWPPPRDRRWPAVVLASLLAALLIGMGVFCLHVDPRGGVPQPAALAMAQGKLAWLKTGSHGDRFALAGTLWQFNYPSKAGGLGEVGRALGAAGDSVVAVRYQPGTFIVWDLSVNGRQIRGYDQIAAAWQSDNRVAHWIGAVLLALAAVFAVRAWRIFKTGT